MNYRHGVRIGFTGAGGTGKTTTAQFISEKLELPTFPSASRQVYIAESLSEDDVLKMTGEERWSLQQRIFQKKIELDQFNQFVTDRTLLDHLAYCLAYCAPYMRNDEFHKTEAMTRSHMKGAYTHVFYFPWGVWQAPPDGVRQELQSWQSQIDAIILGYLARWDIPAFVVPQTQGADERNEWVLNRILGKE